MPWKKLNKTELKRKVKPWVTDEIIRKIKLKSKTYEKYVKCKEIQGNLKNTLFTEYKSLKNEISTQLRDSKKISIVGISPKIRRIYVKLGWE